MSDIFDENSIDRLIDYLKTRSQLKEATHRSLVAKNKLIAAAESGEENMEPIIQEVLAAVEAETRIVAKHLQNGAYLKTMKEKIREAKPGLMEQAESFVGRHDG